MDGSLACCREATLRRLLWHNETQCSLTAPPLFLFWNCSLGMARVAEEPSGAEPAVQGRRQRLASAQQRMLGSLEGPLLLVGSGLKQLEKGNQGGGGGVQGPHRRANVLPGQVRRGGQREQQQVLQRQAGDSGRIERVARRAESSA